MGLMVVLESRFVNEGNSERSKDGFELKGLPRGPPIKLPPPPFRHNIGLCSLNLKMREIPMIIGMELLAFNSKIRRHRSANRILS